MKRTILTLLTTLLVVALIFLLPYAWAYVAGRDDLAARRLALLADAGGASLASRDVPVGALLLYGDSVIGTGYNTVKRDGNAAGHAEINAISDAMRRVGGLDAFNHLDKDSMTILSTFEPCRMCRGAMLEYGITHAQFLKGKGLAHWMREDLRTMMYEWRRRERGPERLQDSLFGVAWSRY